MATLPPGPEFNTFTAIGRCESTGRLGIATSTRSLAVGARVPFVQARTGAVAIMAIADARLGHMAQRLLKLGYKAPAVIEQLVQGDPRAAGGHCPQQDGLPSTRRRRSLCEGLFCRRVDRRKTSTLCSAEVDY